MNTIYPKTAMSKKTTNWPINLAVVAIPILVLTLLVPNKPNSLSCPGVFDARHL